jgi:hypothetical protein
MQGKLSRTFATLLEALNRHRGKGQQKVTVGHVYVAPGGQAVVGVVEPPGSGDRAKLEDQSRARQIAHASQPAMRCPDEARQPVPTGGNGEWPLPDARWNRPRCSEGNRNAFEHGRYTAEAIAGRGKIRELVRAMRALARQEHV